MRQLPHRTGTQPQDLYQDEIVLITRTTLVKISITTIDLVLDALLSLLEDLAEPYNAVEAHPPHVLLSELYIFHLIADCCASNWQGIRQGSAEEEEEEDGAISAQQRAQLPVPKALDDVLVSRIFDVIKLLFDPVPESHILPAKTILDESSSKIRLLEEANKAPLAPLSAPSDEPLQSSRLLRDQAEPLKSQIKTIVEYMTASSWPVVFEYLRSVIYAVRTAAPSAGQQQQQAGQQQPAPYVAITEDEHNALVILRLVSCYWVDGQKLHSVIQEFCSSFLHFRKPFQNTVAIVTPLLITRWIDRFPAEFVRLHGMRRARRDGGPDTLFDMAHTVVDNGRRRAVLFPLQTTLLFLLPDVFEVASNLREAKSSSMAKKVAFLDGLRKALRNRNEQAAYCLVTLLRAARHFDAESESALLSYAMDVQDEVKEAIFARLTPGGDQVLFEQDIMTAAFVSLAHLNFEHCVATLAETCLAPSAPLSFKIAVIQACSHFARLEKAESYQDLFVAASASIQGQLKVRGSSDTPTTSSGAWDVW